MNPSSENPPTEASPTKAGKTRTWWHPLLAALLRWQLGDHYELQEEVPVGLKPLQIDLLLLRKLKGELPDEVRKTLAGLVERFGETTMVEFKSPSDTLRAGDLQTFLAYALLHRAQTTPVLDRKQMHLITIAPRMTTPYRQELDALGVTVEQEELGVWRFSGGPAVFPMWLVETETLYGKTHPLLTLFSPKFLQNGPATYETLRAIGYTEMVVYVSQQVQQFARRGKEFAMQHAKTEDELKQVIREIIAWYSPEERLAGVSLKDRLEGVAPEELVKELPAEKLERLRQLLLPPAKPNESCSS